MAFLAPHFEHDLFVSYAHGAGGTYKRWTRQLVDDLKDAILDETLVDQFKIAIDRDLDVTGSLEDQLRNKVKSSGLLLVIMSKPYLKSRWCKEERDWFLSEVRECQDGGGTVIVVRAHPTPEDDWPDCFKDDGGHVVLGVTFHRDDKPGDNVRFPYGFVERCDNDQKYWQALEKLVTKVEHRLQYLKQYAPNSLVEQPTEQRITPERRGSCSQAETNSNGEGCVPIQVSVEQSLSWSTLSDRPRIYLQAPINQQSEWDKTKADLEGAGYDVLPSSFHEIGCDINARLAARDHLLHGCEEDVHALCVLGTGDVIKDVQSADIGRKYKGLAGKTLPCVVLVENPVDSEFDQVLGIRIIEMTDTGCWLKSFQTWMREELFKVLVS